MEREGSSYSQPNDTAVPRSDDPNSHTVHQGFKRDPDQYMPIASLMRIMQHILPDQVNVADDAKEAIQECVSEFISFITREANERCHRDCRRTLTPNDVVSTMAALGFDNYVESLVAFIDKHRAQDPTRTAMHQLPTVIVRRSENQMAILPPPTSSSTVGGYVPSPPMDRDNYSQLPEIRDYFIDNHGGGQGSSDMEFDPFN